MSKSTDVLDKTKKHNGYIIDLKKSQLTGSHKRAKPYVRYVGETWHHATPFQLRYTSYPLKAYPHWLGGWDIHRKYGGPARNAALRQYHDELRIVDSFFEDWYERKQALNLFVTAGKELLWLLRNYRKPGKVWSRYNKTGKIPSSIPAAWLTYNFGIKPLVGTIDRSLNALGAEFPRKHVRGYGSSTEVGTFNAVHHEGVAFVRSVSTVGCTITGVNPNRALLGATGLNEPFSSAMAVVPWGWAVEYFVNVSELLSNFENTHPGLIIENAFSTTMIRTSPRILHTSKDKRVRDSRLEANIMSMERSLGVPKYVLEFSAPALGSNQAANLSSAIALTLLGAKK